MPVTLRPAQALKLMHEVFFDLVADARPDFASDFTLRQVTILLTIYIIQRTVKGALYVETLGDMVSKSAAELGP